MFTEEPRIIRRIQELIIEYTEEKLLAEMPPTANEREPRPEWPRLRAVRD
jgi:hypothetical protein